MAICVNQPCTTPEGPNYWNLNVWAHQYLTNLGVTSTNILFGSGCDPKLFFYRQFNGYINLWVDTTIFSYANNFLFYPKNNKNIFSVIFYVRKKYRIYLILNSISILRDKDIICCCYFCS